MSEANDKDNQQAPKDSTPPEGDKASKNANAADAKKSQNKALTTAANKAQQKPASRRGMVLAVVLIMVVVTAAGVGGASYWVYQQNQHLAQSLQALSSRQTQQDSNLGNLQTQLGKLDQQQQTLGDKTAQTAQAQRTAKLSIEQVSAQLQTMASDKGKDPLLWRLSEVDYLLSVANHRLLLERDVLTAKVALQDADIRLRALGDPALIPIREKISDEISQLNAVSLPDIPGMAAQLSSLVDGIGQLPLVKKEMEFQTDKSEPIDMQGRSMGEWTKTLLDDIVSGLFVVQRTEQAIEPLLTPDEKQYLSQNLSLKLEQARLALLRADTTIFQRNLNDIKQWVERFFDADAAAVSNVVTTVDQLKTIELKPALPDISASLRELRAWIKHQQQSTRVGYLERQTEQQQEQKQSTSPPLSRHDVAPQHLRDAADDGVVVAKTQTPLPVPVPQPSNSAAQVRQETP